MPQVLTTHAIITCPHGGVGTTVPSAPLWTVNGGNVLVEGDVGVLSCLFPYPCGGYRLQSMGLNASRIQGRKVILVTDFNKSFTGLPLAITETHTTLDGGTPAPIPAGAPAPPPTLEMADRIKPVGTGLMAVA